MTKTKKRIGSFGLALAITYLVFILVCLYGELFAYNSYVNSLPDENNEGWGVLGILIYGVYMMYALIAVGVLTLIPAIITLATKKANVARAMSIWLIITQFIAAAAFLFYFTVLVAVYFSIFGVILKVLYLAVAGLSIFSAILAIKGLKVFKDVPAEVRI